MPQESHQETNVSLPGNVQDSVSLLLSQILVTSQKRVLLDITKRFAFMCEKVGVPYFLYSGSLLGSFRHHDVIPWDDDVDVLVNISSRDELFSALRFLSPQYEIFLAGPHLKMWSAQSVRTSRYPWRWPYLDVSFFMENNTHIWDAAEEFKHYIFPKSLIYPLHKRPLGNYFFFSPRDSYAVLKLTYKSVHCSLPDYSHRTEKSYNHPRSKSISCALLKDRIPFVHRMSVQDGVLETLKLGNSTMHSLFVPEPKYAVTHPYKLVLLEGS